MSDESKQNANKADIDFFSNQFSNKTRSIQTSRITAPKQHAITPAIHKLCKHLDDDLSKLLSDIEFSTNTTESSVNRASTEQQMDELRIFGEYLQTNLELFCDNVCKSLGDLIYGLRNELDSATVGLRIKKILLICRFAHALPNSCTHLKVCFSNLIQQRNQPLSGKTTSTDPLMSSLLKKKQNEQKVNKFSFKVKFLSKKRLKMKKKYSFLRYLIGLFNEISIKYIVLISFLGLFGKRTRIY